MSETLDGQYRKWWESKRCPEHPHQHATEEGWAKAGFLAGATAEREAVLEIVAATHSFELGHPHSCSCDECYHGPGLDTACDEIERRIRQREISTEVTC